MGRQWTADQKAAIDDRRGELLLSAAAGSGKTAVLVERILRRVLEGTDVDRFLVVTFTNAAAAEMREKLRGEMERRLTSAGPDEPRLTERDKKHLRRQLTLISGADISTIDAFCIKLVRQNFAALGLPPALRVISGAEEEELQNKAVEQVLDREFEAGTPAFLALADALSGAEDDGGFAELIRDNYRRMSAAPDLPAQADRAVRDYAAAERGIAATPWGAALLDHAEQGLRDFKARLVRLQEIAAQADLHGYDDFLAEREGILDALLGHARDWNGLRERVLAFKVKNLPSKRKDWPEELAEAVKAFHNDLKSFVTGDHGLSSLFSADDESACRVLLCQRPLVEELMRVTLAFAEEFAALKAERGGLDFADAEQFAYRLLVAGEGEDGEIVPTELGADLSRRFEEVLVDEYQDTNRLQDGIFRALTAERGDLFMVGDVKQSIYRFRKAEPAIFQHKYDTYPDAEGVTGRHRRTLGINFRSRREVLSAVNDVFAPLCVKAFSEIVYGEKERLHFPEGREGGAPDDRYCTEFHLVPDATDDEEDLRKVPAEYLHLAARLRQMLDEGFPVAKGKDPGETRPLRPGDIACLMRSDAGNFAKLTEALERYGIPCDHMRDTAFFDTLEVATAKACLEAVENPLDDVALLGFLRCPRLAFTAEMLAEIRAVGRDVPLWENLQVLAESESGPFADAAALLSELRVFAGEHGVSEILRRVCDRTCLFAGFSARKQAAERRKNISELWGVAREYEAREACDLRGFIRFLDALSQRENREEPPAGEDAVQIMTIHKSKGLEYPVVAVVRTGKQFNTRDAKSSVQMHGELGIAMRRRDGERRLDFATAATDAIGCRITREEKAEELRLLYVAMTRAKEKLLVYTQFPRCKKLVEKLAGIRSRYVSGCPDAEWLGSRSSVAEWIWMSLICKTEGGLASFGPDSPEAVAGDSHLFYHQDLPEAPDEIGRPAEPETRAMPSGAAVRARLAATYPYADAVGIPSKQTVTELKGREKDDELDEPPVLPEDLPVPRFLQETASAEGTRRGTAVHMVLSHMDPGKNDEPSVAACIREMTERQLLAPEDAGAVSASEIARFFATPLGRRVADGGERLLREFKFSVLVPAEELAPVHGADADRVLLQGVADALILAPEGIVLLDYKTDRWHGESREEFLAQKKERYKTQVDSYAKALERIFARPVTEKWLCFLSEGENLELETDQA